MLQITYKHKVNDDGSVSLEYFKYADDKDPSIVVCELVGDEIVWHTPPDKYTKGAVECSYRNITCDEYYYYYGLKSKYKLPEVTFDNPYVKVSDYGL